MSPIESEHLLSIDIVYVTDTDSKPLHRKLSTPNQ
jgi:hypothetical protein